MPKIKPLIRPDPLETDVISEIASGMAQTKTSMKDLARLTGINYSTLTKRIGRTGDIKTLRLGELILIRKALAQRM